MKQRISLLLVGGLTAVIFLLTGCNQTVISPTPEVTRAPEIIAPTALPTPLPTSTPTPEATATPELTTREQWRLSLAACCPHLTAAPEVLLLALWGIGADGDFVADIGQAAAVIEPRYVEAVAYPDDVWAIVVVASAPADGRYPPGTLFVDNWEAIQNLEGADPNDYAARMLILAPSEPGNQIDRGIMNSNGAVPVYIEVNPEGKVIAYVDPSTNRWRDLLNADADGYYTLYIESDIEPDGKRDKDGTLFWTNGGEPVAIPTGPDGAAMSQFLADNPGLSLNQVEHNGNQVVGLVDAETGELRYTLTSNPDNTIIWTQAEQPTLTERQFYSDVPFTFLPNDMRGVGRELPEGVERILTMQELDEKARAINFTPAYGCSTEYGPDGWFHTVAVILSYDTARIVFSSNTTVDYEGFWLQTCGVGPNGELVPVIVFAPFKVIQNEAGVITELDERSRVNFNTWNRANGQVEPAQTLSPTYLDNNRSLLIGRAVVIRQPSNINSSQVSLTFADLVNPLRNGFAGINETDFNYDFRGLRPFMGTVALDKPQ